MSGPTSGRWNCNLSPCNRPDCDAPPCRDRVIKALRAEVERLTKDKESLLDKVEDFVKAQRSVARGR